jgi:ABC-type branched-subunit amino acid transport system substrate-binding protein
MVNSSPQTQVYCTRPSCQHPLNHILEECLISGSIRQRFCSCCGMPLILEGRFLPFNLLIPDRERGGFGRTFLAQDLSFPHRPLRVIKQLHPQIPHGRSKFTPEELETIERMFHREATVLEKFQHAQIPRARAFFTVEVLRDLQGISTQETDSQQKLFYLAQDYIEGQNLAQEQQQNGQFSGREIINILKQILPILDYVHKEGAIHRDIKPSNIMRCSNNESSNGKLYLIDFGAVKQVSVARVPTEQSCILGTPDYAPPEQFTGRAVSASSDLYSLAATCVYLLTAKKSRELRNQEDKWNWQKHVNVTDHLASILTRMLLPIPEERFQSAQEVLTALSSVEDSKPIEPSEPLKSTRRPAPTTLSILERVQIVIRQRRFAFLALLALISTFLIAFIIHLITPPTCLQYECDRNNSFSWGEQILMQPASGINAVKTAGTEAFYQGKYDLAINNFQEYLKSNRNDPEAIIYLNNAYAARTKNPIKIAVVVPIVINQDIDKEFLRGVAHLQSELNCSLNNNLQGVNSKIKIACHKNGINNRFLQVLIANDKQNSEEAQKVADNLVKNKDILGVIGHFTSRVTSDVAITYGNGGLVVISPTSTVPRKAYGLNFHPDIFRTAPTDTIAARSLVNYIKIKGYTKATIVVDDDIYTQSLAREFQTIFQSEGGTVVGDYCNLKKQGLRLEKCLKKAQRIDNFNVVLLALTDEVSKKAARNIYSNSSNPNIIGGDGMYNPEQLEVDIDRIGQEKLVIAVPWHRSEKKEGESPFETSSRQLWNGALVNWRTAMTYDATKVVVEGLSKLGNNPTRSGLYEQLSKNNFSIQGATGKVEFDENHDRKPSKAIGVLVHVQPNAENKPVFVRL